MAKEKKPSAGKSGSAKAKAPKSKSTGTEGGVPPIDTTLAAQNAAALVARGGGATSNPDSSTNKPRAESAAFKHLKESLNKPTLNSPTGNFGVPFSGKKSSQTGGPQKQTGRNQTFGADASRAFVPRRTGGG